MIRHMDDLGKLIGHAAAAIQADGNCAPWATETRARDAARAAVYSLIPRHGDVHMLGAVLGYELGLDEPRDVGQEWTP